MRILVCTLAVLALAAPAAHSAALVRASTPVCDLDAHSATFEADMRSRPGTVRMQIRFLLQTRAEGRWARVKAPGFGEWQASDPGVARYVYSKTVENLPVPGAYRASVQFRWLGPAGLVIARRTRRTPVCRMPDPRPDLQVVALEAQPRGWAAVVRNSGLSDAGPFWVAAIVDGTAEGTRRVESLVAGEQAVVPFDGPCGGVIRVTVDAGDAVDERDEEDNLFEAPCPTLP